MEVSIDLFLARAQQTLRNAVREWINVELVEVYPLSGGISGAPVYFVNASISFPGLEEQEPKEVPFVMKFSTSRTFDIELEKFNSLDKEHKKYFLNFATMKKQVDAQFFMVMEHLKDYQTLESLLYATPLQIKPRETTTKIVEVLKSIQFDHLRSSPKPNVGNIFRLYLGEIDRLLSEVLKRHEELLINLYSQNSTINGRPVLSMKESFERICTNWKEFEPSYTTRMHGDCHARNIMVNLASDVKLIDIDQLDEEGDYLLDFGELITDLEIFGYILGARRFVVERDSENHAYRYVVDPPQAVREAAETMRQLLKDQEKQKKQEKQEKHSWEKRLKLAGARYLISMLTKIEKYEVDKILATYLEAARLLSEVAESLPNQES